MPENAEVEKIKTQIYQLSTEEIKEIASHCERVLDMRSPY